MESTARSSADARTKPSVIRPRENVHVLPDGLGRTAECEFVPTIDMGKDALKSANVTSTTPRCAIRGPESVFANQDGVARRVIDLVRS